MNLSVDGVFAQMVVLFIRQKLIGRSLLRNIGLEVPDEYSAPGEFYLADLEDDNLYDQINKNNPYGKWLLQCEISKFGLDRD